MASSAAYQREWRKKNAAKIKQYRARYQPEWRKKNPDKVKQYTAKYYASRKHDEEYKAKVRERARAWHKEKLASDPEGVRVKSQTYYERNKEKIKAHVIAQRKKKVAQNPESVRAKRRAKYYANAEKARAYSTEWRKQNPERVRENNLKKFGIGVEQYDALLISQNKGCAICGGQNSNGRALAVDHCHKTGKIRGLLCSGCNRGIGLLGDSSCRLKLAAEYVAKWGN